MLHRGGFHTSDIPLGDYSLSGFQSDALDIHAMVAGEPHAKFGLRLIPVNEGAQTILLTCTANEVCLNDKIVPNYHDDDHRREDQATVDIRLFLDRSVVEVFVDSRVCLTLVLQPPASPYRVELFSENSTAMVRQLDAWVYGERCCLMTNSILVNLEPSFDGNLNLQVWSIIK